MAGPIVLSGATVAAGILRPLYRRALGAQYGPFGVYTTDGVASGGEANRQIVCSDLIDDEEQADRLKGRYLYIATGDNAGFQTRVLSTGYHGPIGYAEVSRPLPTPCPSGIEFELSTWPCDQYLDQKGLNQIVSPEALARCLVEYRLSLTGNGTRSYSLLAYEGYIDEPASVDAIYDAWTTAAGEPMELVPYAPRIDVTSGTRTLITRRAFATSETFQVRVLRSGSGLINTDGVWGTSSVGLTNDTQGALAPIPWVVSIGMVKLLQIATEMVEQDETLSDATKARRLTLLMNRRAQWTRAANRIIRFEFPDPTSFSESLMSGTTTLDGLGISQRVPTTVPLV